MTRAAPRRDLRAERREMVARQVESAKRLRLVADILGEPEESRIRRAAAILLHPEGLPAETGFMLVLLTDAVLGQGPLIGP